MVPTPVISVLLLLFVVLNVWYIIISSLSSLSKCIACIIIGGGGGSGAHEGGCLLTPLIEPVPMALASGHHGLGTPPSPPPPNVQLVPTPLSSMQSPEFKLFYDAVGAALYLYGLIL